MKNWKKLQSEIVHTNPWYDVRHDTVIRPDGSNGDYYVVETRGASVFAVVINEKNEILLIGQERYTSGKYSWEVPGGNSDGQDPLIAIQRELMEETGYEATTWKSLGCSYPMDGISSEKSYIFMASDLSQNEPTQQAEEGITDMRWFSYDSIKEMIRTGEITDNQTIVAITKAALDLHII